jgi:hypothetical protein
MSTKEDLIQCPLKQHINMYERACIRAHCAWWDIEGGECCIHTIAKQGLYAATTLNFTLTKIVNELDDISAAIKNR